MFFYDFATPIPPHILDAERVQSLDWIGFTIGYGVSTALRIVYQPTPFHIIHTIYAYPQKALGSGLALHYATYSIEKQVSLGKQFTSTCVFLNYI